MDHGDSQEKSAFIFIDDFIELYIKWVSINVFTPRSVFLLAPGGAALGRAVSAASQPVRPHGGFCGLVARRDVCVLA